MLMKRHLTKLVYSKWFYRFCILSVLKLIAVLFLYYVYSFPKVTLAPRGPLSTGHKPEATSNYVPDGKIILLWTSFYDKWVYPHGDPKACAPEKLCTVTTNRSKLSESHAVVFHVRDIDLTDLPTVRYPHQRWIFFNLEPPPYSYFLGFRFMRSMFNWTMTYRLDSDVVVKYGGFVPKSPDKENEEVSMASTKNKTEAAYWMVSHCYTSSRRETFVEQLSYFMPVDIYGKCGKAVCPKGQTQDCLKSFSEKFYFALTMENSFCEDYVSEKFYEASRYDAIPVVMGGADYSRFAPRHSYIDASDFGSPRELAAFLDKLTKSHGFYRSYFDWKKKFEPETSNMFCDLCHKLKTAKDSEVTVYEDMVKWWVEGGRCRTLAFKDY